MASGPTASTGAPPGTSIEPTTVPETSHPLDGIAVLVPTEPLRPEPDGGYVVAVDAKRRSGDDPGLEITDPEFCGRALVERAVLDRQRPPEMVCQHAVFHLLNHVTAAAIELDKAKWTCRRRGALSRHQPSRERDEDDAAATALIARRLVRRLAGSMAP